MSYFVIQFRKQKSTHFDVSDISKSRSLDFNLISILKYCLIFCLPRNQAQEEAPSTTEEEEKAEVTPTVEVPVECTSPQEEAKPEEPASVEPDAPKEEPALVEETPGESETPAVEEVKGKEPSSDEPEATTIEEKTPKDEPVAVESEAPAAEDKQPESEPPPAEAEAPVIDGKGVESEASPAEPELENIPVSEEQKEDTQVKKDSPFIPVLCHCTDMGFNFNLEEHQIFTFIFVSLFLIAYLDISFYATSADFK
jgi:hypothetical protein